MTIYLLRVGVDSISGGFLSIIQPDLSYFFIHVIEEIEDYTPGTPFVKYRNMKWNGTSVSSFVPDILLDRHVHIDPEFISYTYGSPQKTWVESRNEYKTDKNLKKLSKLERGDFIVFYAAFNSAETQNAEQLDGYYIFSYLFVDFVVIYSDPTQLNPVEAGAIQYNHHYIQQWRDQIVIKGDPDRSMVLKKAVPLSIKSRNRIGSNYYPSEDMQSRLGGYQSALNRSSLRKMPINQSFQEFIDYITQLGEGTLRGDSRRIHTLPNLG